MNAPALQGCTAGCTKPAKKLHQHGRNHDDHPLRLSRIMLHFSPLLGRGIATLGSRHSGEWTAHPDHPAQRQNPRRTEPVSCLSDAQHQAEIRRLHRQRPARLCREPEPLSAASFGIVTGDGRRCGNRTSTERGRAVGTHDYQSRRAIRCLPATGFSRHKGY